MVELKGGTGRSPPSPSASRPHPPLSGPAAGMLQTEAASQRRGTCVYRLGLFTDQRSLTILPPFSSL